MAAYTFFTNPRSRGLIASWALHEVGADFAVVPVGWGEKPPALLAANPLGKVPTLVHHAAEGDRVVTEAARLAGESVAAITAVSVEFDADPVVKSASSEEAGHDKGMMADKNAKTFWAGSSADATFSFEAAGFSLSQVGIQPTGKDWDRVKKVEIVANGRSVIRDVPDNATAISWIEIPSVVGYTGSAWGTIEVKVLETYPGAKNAGKLGITELKAKATAYEGI